MFWNTSKFVRSFAARSWQKIILNAKSLQAVQSSRHPRRAWLGDNSSQQNENKRLDTGRAGSSYLHSSGVLTALVSQEGSRCVSPFRRRGNSGAAPATVGGEPFSEMPLGFAVRGLGRRRTATTREP